MRVNVYAEEMTDRVEIVSKVVEGRAFTAVRFYLELPATVGGVQHRGPFIHRPGDDDSSAVTFWGKRDLRPLFRAAGALLDAYYDEHPAEGPHPKPEADVACAECKVLGQHQICDHGLERIRKAEEDRDELKLALAQTEKEAAELQAQLSVLQGELAEVRLNSTRKSLLLRNAIDYMGPERSIDFLLAECTTS